MTILRQAVETQVRVVEIERAGRVSVEALGDNYLLEIHKLHKEMNELLKQSS